MNATMNKEIVPPFTGGAITMVHGKTRRFRIQVQDRATAVPTDITGWTSFRFLGKYNLADLDGSAAVTKSLGSGISVIQASSGLIEILLLAADTSSLADTGVHLFAETQGVDPAGLPWTLWQGELDVLPAVILAGN